ncbi:uncharacterized protein LOC131642835 [Vicia villosa]|uniref:uncharacterized protein LOC131642835 n=1 Tax=Vicia villosa TaxID=3911 RepID=UPI00273CE900|nr:uncharacterized protein LOC131642835 [Vicia villosa]
MIYGLVLFPNIPNFVDLTAICLFMDENPVPTLLADTYYAIHSRYGAKGAVGGCLPLLYEWFISHLPKSGPFVTTRDSQKWPQRIMGLTANDIVWYHIGKGIEEVITRCGSFDNVPLIGTKGVINYNPRLALRQLGFTLKDKPLDKEIFESVCFEKGADPKGLEKNAIAKQAYTDWVKDRVKERLLPFPKVKPLYEQPPEVLTATVPTEDYTQVHVEKIRLREKGQDAKIEYFLVNQKRAELAHEVKMLKGGSSRVQKRTRTEKGERATTIVVKDHQKIIKKAIKETEEKLKQEYREDLKAYKLKIKRKLKLRSRV